MSQSERERPIRDAAEEVRLLAVDARASLAELRQGWLFQLLALTGPTAADVSKDQKSPAR
jgi:hypothetical protein